MYRCNAQFWAKSAQKDSEVQQSTSFYSPEAKPQGCLGIPGFLQPGAKPPGCLGTPCFFFFVFFWSKEFTTICSPRFFLSPLPNSVNSCLVSPHATFMNSSLYFLSLSLKFSHFLSLSLTFSYFLSLSLSFFANFQNSYPNWFIFSGNSLSLSFSLTFSLFLSLFG